MEGAPGAPLVELTSRKERESSRLWSDIKAAYMASNLSIDLVAAEFEVPLAAARARASREKWSQQRKRLWGEPGRMAQNQFALSVAARAATFLRLEADDAVEHLIQLRNARISQGKRWTMHDHANYARAVLVQSERARRALGIKASEATPGPQEVRFLWVPRLARPASREVVTIENGKPSDPASKPGQDS